MTSKSGLIRGHIQGKRVDFCARSVITPEATTWVDELVVPECFAKSLTYPVRVTSYNIRQCQALLDQDKVNNIIRDGEGYNASKKLWTRGFELRENDIIKRADGKKINVYTYYQQYQKYPALLNGDSVIRYGTTYTDVKPREKIGTFKVQIGDTIERQLQDGDWTLFNRQPTLWKGSMRAMRIKVMPGKTLRFNLACTNAFNADFDGGK
jgi:DNA-directed RNA polymerase beta' subunit